MWVTFRALSVLHYKLCLPWWSCALYYFWKNMWHFTINANAPKMLSKTVSIISSRNFVTSPEFYWKYCEHQGDTADSDLCKNETLHKYVVMHLCYIFHIQCIIEDDSDWTKLLVRLRLSTQLLWQVCWWGMNQKENSTFKVWLSDIQWHTVDLTIHNSFISRDQC